MLRLADVYPAVQRNSYESTCAKEYLNGGKQAYAVHNLNTELLSKRKSKMNQTAN